MTVIFWIDLSKILVFTFFYKNPTKPVFLPGRYKEIWKKNLEFFVDGRNIKTFSSSPPLDCVSFKISQAIYWEIFMSPLLWLKDFVFSYLRNDILAHISTSVSSRTGGSDGLCTWHWWGVGVSSEKGVKLGRVWSTSEWLRELRVLGLQERRESLIALYSCLKGGRSQVGSVSSPK